MKMKKKIILMAIFSMFIGLNKIEAKPINENFNDDLFYDCVIRGYNAGNGTNYDTTKNLTDEELSTIKEIVCSDTLEISDATGIEKLTNLEIFETANTSIEKIDLSKNTKLKSIDIRNNKIEKLDLTNQKDLKVLRLEGNKLKKLIVAKEAKLDTLSIGETNFSDLEFTIYHGEELLIDDIISLPDEYEIVVNIDINDVALAENGKIVTNTFFGHTKAEFTVKGTIVETINQETYENSFIEKDFKFTTDVTASLTDEQFAIVTNGMNYGGKVYEYIEKQKEDNENFKGLDGLYIVTKNAELTNNSSTYIMLYDTVDEYTVKPTGGYIQFEDNDIIDVCLTINNSMYRFNSKKDYQKIEIGKSCPTVELDNSEDTKDEINKEDNIKEETNKNDNKKEEVKNPNTGVVSFTFVSVLVIAISVIAYTKLKNKYSRL